jgi:hypothetical protein
MEQPGSSSGHESSKGIEPIDSSLALEFVFELARLGKRKRIARPDQPPRTLYPSSNKIFPICVGAVCEDRSRRGRCSDLASPRLMPSGAVSDLEVFDPAEFARIVSVGRPRPLQVIDVAEDPASIIPTVLNDIMSLPL